MPGHNRSSGLRKASKMRQAGKAALEFVVAYAGVLIPLTFAVIFTSQILWVWHSVNDFTRRGAEYASTHCWTSAAGNVTDYMRNNVPAMINQDQFQSGPVEINVTYFAKDPDSGQLVPFMCDSDCSTSCVPETVAVSVTGYEFRTLLTALGLPPVTLPDFRTALPMESAGCDPEQGICLP